MDSSSDAEYCAVQVRQYDYHRFFATAFMPPARRRAVLAIYAFNVEIAGIRELVSEPLIGRMRLQWWRDTVDEIYRGSTVRGHAVARELAIAVGEAGLDRTAFEELLDARAFDLEEDPPEDLEALTAYARGTAAPLFALAGAAGGDAVRKDVAEAAGVAWGLAGLLRAAPTHVAQGKVFLPYDLLRENRLEPSRLSASFKGAAARAVASGVASRAERAYALLKRDLDARPARDRSAFLYLPVAARYLRRLRRCGHDLSAYDARTGRLADQIAILRAAVSGRF